MESLHRTRFAVCGADRNRDVGPHKVARASIRRDAGALSTFTGQAELSTLWKHEVSQRAAAHRKLKAAGATDADSQALSNRVGSSRLSGAAARVAARYA